MSRNRVALVLSLLAVGTAPLAAAASACNVQAKVPASARTLAKTNILSDWLEYSSLDEAPTLMLDGGMSAQVWQDHGANQSVTIVEPGQNFSMVTRYCFDSHGALQGVGLEIRTPLGWGYRAEGSVSGGAFLAATSEFFNLGNGKRVPKPEDVARVPRALQPVLYLKQSELPFASLLTVTAKAKKHTRAVSAPNPTESVAETSGAPSGN